MKKTIPRRCFLAIALALLATLTGCQKATHKTIGFVVTTLSNPYFVTMTEAAKNEIKNDRL
jgi:ABC-type sugar transport system substrate-binding protein